MQTAESRSTSKYSPLHDFLAAQEADEVPLTFAEIERIVGFDLPPSSSYRAWWSNNPANSVMTGAWLDAGFVSAKVDMKNKTLVFRRAEPRRPAAADLPSPSDKSVELVTPEQWAESAGRRVPDFIGSLKATVTVNVTVDLTAPSDDVWSGAT